MTDNITQPFCLVLSLLCLFPVATQAQVEVAGDTVCINAARALTTVTPDRSVARALSELITCPSSGPRAIAGAWARPPRDPGVLASLADVTGRLRDRRVHEAARAVLLDRAADTYTRLSALTAIAAHGDPCLALHIRISPTDAPGAYAYVMPGWRNDHQSRPGTEALSPSIREEVIALLDRLAKEEPEHPVDMVARLGARELRRTDGTRRC